jgi:hypothetical protein
VRLTVTGKVELRGDTVLLALDRMKTPVALKVTAQKDNPTAEHLKKHAGETVELEGLWQAPPAGEPGPGTLAATAIHNAKDGRKM